MDEYLLYARKRLPVGAPWKKRWDLLVSAYNSSERVKMIRELASAREKWWLMLPEYKYSSAEYPTGNVYNRPAENEADLLLGFLETLGEKLPRQRLAFDITGFVGHYVIVLLELLRRAGVEECDLLYGEPVRYMQSERTRFSDEAVLEVRQVTGFEGLHTPDTTEDLLVLAVGYDYRLVSEIASAKEHARKAQIFGLPSLRPDMYQESLLRAARVAEALGPNASNPRHFHFAPAYDPFATASVLSSVVRRHREQHPRANVYLSPLSTKAQALGFAFYYLRECQETPTSVLYPFCGSYMRETSEGLSGVWMYHIEFSRLRPNAGEVT